MIEDKLNMLQALRKQVLEGDEDTLRALVKSGADALMSAEADALCGAAYGARADERENRRNGYRSRDWDTRAGTVELAIPKLRQGSYYPDWLLTPRRRSEEALTQVIVDCYVRGISTRRVEGLVETMGLKGMSKSQVSALAQRLDSVVEDFRSRPLDASPYRYVWVDALTQRCRDGGRVVNVWLLVATAVTQEGRREILGFEVITQEDGPSWTSFLRTLVARGLSGVELVISDAHAGLKGAIAAVFPGASWQRCRTHFMRNLLSKVPKQAQSMVATLVRTIFEQGDKESVEAQHKRVVEQLEKGKFNAASSALDEAKDEVLAFADFPKAHWKKIRSNNPQERLNKEIRRRTDVVGIFPDRNSIIRLVGALLSEQNDEWVVTKRYMTFEAEAPAVAIPQIIEHATEQKEAA